MRPKTAVATSSAQVPGPGTYRIESSVGRDAPAASISGRFDLTTDSYQPGPGAYDVRKVGEVGSDAPAFTMAGRPTAHNDSTVAGKGTPGPGQYTVTSPSTAPAITMQGRHEPHEASRDQWKVGPGAYEVVVARESPAYSMSGRHATKTAADVPGPGHYTLQSDMGKAPAASLSGRHETKEDISAPGPGQYQATYGATKQGATHHTPHTTHHTPHTTHHTTAHSTCTLHPLCLATRHTHCTPLRQPGPPQTSPLSTPPHLSVRCVMCDV